MFNIRLVNRNFFFLKILSKYYNKKIYLKLENQNLTGSHKDRECIKLINLANINKYKKIGFASTGNSAIAVAFYSKLTT